MKTSVRSLLPLLALALSACALPPGAATGNSKPRDVAPPAQVAAPAAPLKVGPLNAPDIEDVIKANKLLPGAEKVLVGEKVKLFVKSSFARKDLKGQMGFISSQPKQELNVTYLCSKWDKAFKVGSTVEATVTYVKSGLPEFKGTDIIVGLSGCAKGTPPATPAPSAEAREGLTHLQLEKIAKRKTTQQFYQAIAGKVVRVTIHNIIESLDEKHAHVEFMGEKKGIGLVGYSCPNSRGLQDGMTVSGKVVGIISMTGVGHVGNTGGYSPMGEGEGDGFMVRLDRCTVG